MRKLFVLSLFVMLAALSSYAQVMNTSIYPDDADAHKDMKAALAKAKAQNKSVQLEFGADWCYDCHVLDYRFHQPEIQPILDKYFIVVHVNIGRGETNVDIANKYQI